MSLLNMKHNRLTGRTSASRKRRRTAAALSVIMIFLLILQLAASLVRTPPARSNASTDTGADKISNKQAMAQSALQTYFLLLGDRRVEEATSYYGGSYEALAQENPAECQDHAALLRDS